MLICVKIYLYKKFSAGRRIDMMNKEELNKTFEELINLNERGELLGIEIFVSHHKGGPVPPKTESFKYGDISDAAVAAMALRNDRNALLATIERLAEINPDLAAELKAEFSNIGNE